jgi:CRISPR-associated protein Csb1
MTEFKNGSPNPERRVLGGIHVRDRVEREITINLSALRRLRGTTEAETLQIRRYLLSLTLIAAIADGDLFLRSGCQLQIPQEEDEWSVVPRRGLPGKMIVPSDTISKVILPYAIEAAEPFKKHWPKTLVHKFDIKEAKKLLGKKADEDSEEG